MESKNTKAMNFGEVTDLDLSVHNYDHIPDEVFKMSHLESIRLGQGKEINVSDRYKLMDAIPTIKTIDNNDVSQIRSGITNLNSIFVRRLQEMFLTKAASEIYFEEINEEARIEKMVSLAKMTIAAGPEILKDFKDYKIEKLIRENYEVYVSEALEVTVKVKEEKENKGPPAKKKKGAPNTKGKTKLKSTPSQPSTKLSADLLVNLKLERLVRTHSRNNDNTDTATKVWMCEFEPDIHEPGKTTSVVATCGGDSVCYINCDASKSAELVLKKFHCPNENFYCIAWTTHTGLTETKTILAAGGTLGTVKIIDASDNRIECYDCTKNKKSVDCMVFHSTVPYWLFTGSEDKTIVMWDFQKQFAGDKANPKRLVTFKPPTEGPIRQITVIPHGKIVFGACDEGVYAWEVEPISLSAVNRPVLYKLKFKNKKDFYIDSTIALSNNLLGVKRVGEGYIHIFHSSSEFMKEDATIVYSLRWSATLTPFLKVNFTPGSNILLAGDDEGFVWMYGLNDLVQVAKKSKVIKLSHEIMPKKIRFKQSSSSSSSSSASRPQDKVLFNHVTCSTDLHHVVAVCDNNLVAIWNQSS